MTTTHTLKVHPQFWQALIDDKKKFELRRNDRGFQVNDLLVLRCYDPAYGYDGQERTAAISYILMPEDCPGLQPGFCILGFAGVL